ncbi:MAG: hypothetical protein WAM97_10110 [Acidimicrobiales bacterium]
MARQDSGKWVSRAGSTGGGRTYRAKVPYRWYSGLALIVILGVFLVGYSRYELFHPQAAPPPVQPTTSDHWVAGLSFDICGKNETLAASPATDASLLSIYTTGNGVLQIEPKSAADAGANATVGLFSAQYKGLTLTANSVGLPKKPVYTDGEKCPSGTPDAGKTGQVFSKIWPTLSSSSPSVQNGDPRQVRWQSSLQLVTVAFVPITSTVPLDQDLSKSVLAADNELIESEQTTTTTLPVSSSTTLPVSSTTTTTPGATTTTTAAKSTTTTTSAGTTTTTG